MRKSLFASLIVAFFLLAGRAWAKPPSCPTNPVYISSGSRILCVDRTPASLPAQVVVVTTVPSAVFEDLAFGPDGNIYAADSSGVQVVRVNPTTRSHAQVAVFPSGSGAPTGLSFSGSDGDLYVNTSTGVWKIARIASLFSPIVSTPVTLTSADKVISFSPSITAGGSAFDIPGNLNIMDQSDNQVLQAAPTYSSLTGTPVTGISNTGPGIAVNFCGDLLVASGNAVKRFSNSALSTYESLGSSNDLVRYLEVTADNRVLVATFSSSAGGKVWRIDPVVDSVTGVPSCVMSPTATLLVSLGTSTIANGVALPPTSITVTHTFGAPDAGPCTPTTVPDQRINKRVYNFGHHTYSVTYMQLRRCFTQAITAVRSQPAHITFSSSTFPTNTVPMLYASLGGFAVQYVTPDPAPDPTSDYVSTGDGHAIEMKLGYNTVEVVLNPGLAHAGGDVLLTSPTAAITYTDNFTRFFWAGAGPGLDPGTGACTDGWGSTFVVFNADLKIVVAGTITIKEPPLSNNPQFNAGQTIRVAFNLTDPSGAAIPNALMRLSVLRLSRSLNTEAVVSTNNVNVDNIFKTGSGNLYTFPLDSSAFAPLKPGTVAIYQFTIFGDSAQPFPFSIMVLF